MRKRAFIVALFGVILSILAILGIANATLYDRGGGLIYDSDLNITWTQKSNLGLTESFGVNGISQPGDNWYSYAENAAGGEMWMGLANDYITAMNKANYLGYNDWRLPLMDKNRDGVFANSWDDPLALRDNELGYMRYQLLTQYTRIRANVAVDPELCDFQINGFWIEDIKYGNMDVYMSGNYKRQWDVYLILGIPIPIPSNKPYLYDMSSGYIRHAGDTFQSIPWTSWYEEYGYVWPVRNGDIFSPEPEPVPEPATMLLLGSGLIGLAGYGRKKFFKK